MRENRCDVIIDRAYVTLARSSVAYYSYRYYNRHVVHGVQRRLTDRYRCSLLLAEVEMSILVPRALMFNMSLYVDARLSYAPSQDPSHDR